MLKIKIMEYIIAVCVVIVIAVLIIRKQTKSETKSQPQGGYGVNEEEKQPGKHNKIKED